MQQNMMMCIKNIGFIMIKYIKRVGMIIIYVKFCMINADELKWFYPQLFDRKARIINAHKKELFFKKENVHPFTQLLLSWNVMRPEKGFFSFYIQVRNVQTKQWGDWYLMANWGNGIQKTYLTKSDGLASCVHVRLELDHAKMADAFCIKVEPHDGAQLNVLDAIAVAVSDFSLFQSEQCDLIMHNVKSAVIPGMPTIAQFAFDHSDNSRICSL